MQTLQETLSQNLSEKDVDEIISLSKQPGWLMKDIAQKYRVPSNLVGRICREADRQPQKILTR